MSRGRGSRPPGPADQTSSTWWAKRTARAPSPTAPATRLVAPARTSPAAKTPARRSRACAGRLLHLLHVGLRAHDDADARGVDLEVLELRLGRGLRLGSGGAGSAHAARCPVAAGGRRSRSCRRQHTRRRGRTRRRRPSAVTLRTRPPAVTTVAVALGRPRVDDLGALAGRRVEAGDHVAARTSRRVARARRARRSPPRAGPSRARRPPGRPGAVARSSRSSRSLAQPREDDLGLRVAEADVELEHLRRRPSVSISPA